MGQVFAFAWYRLRTTFARRWRGLCVIVLLIGLLGGLAMASVAGARRTQSSFPAYLTRTNAPNLGLMSAIASPPLGNTPYDATLIAKIARLRFVKQVADFTIVNPNMQILVRLHGHPRPGEAPPTMGGSLDGAYSKVGRVTATSGRTADPTRLDEVFISAGAARYAGLHVGSVVPIEFFTNAQLGMPDCCSANGTGKLAPRVKVNLKVVGIGVVDATELIEDDVDRLSDSYVILTPALIRRLVPCCAFATETGITVKGGNRNASKVVAEVASVGPRAQGSGASAGGFSSVGEAKAERAIEPESIAFALFGIIVAFAVLLVVGQVISRQLRAGSAERQVLRALGATRVMASSDGLLAIVGAIVAGGVLAGIVAIVVSPLTLLGPVRSVAPSGVAVDWTVLAAGVCVLILVLSVLAAVISYRQAPHRVRAPSRRGSRVGRIAAETGLPSPAVTGIRFALEPGAGPDAVPARSAILGAVLALVVLTATVVFAASLHTLVSRPALYGWNWNYELLSGYSGQEDLPQHTVATLLDRNPYVSAWSGIYFAHASVDGRGESVIGADPDGAVQPPVLSGRGLDGPGQIVLGPATLASLHKHVGDSVTVVIGKMKPASLRVVGTATMPAIGTGLKHSTMGTGVWLDYQLIPSQLRNVQQSTIPGPQAVLIRTRTNADSSAALRSLQQVNNTINKDPESPAGGVTGVLRPAEIVNYRSIGTTPALFGAALAVGATAALMLTLVASVRRRRRDLALLKTLGFTRRQLAGVIAWQSSIAVVIGIIVGVPLGIVIGRTLWNLFAHAIHAVPHPTVPAGTIAIISVGALLLANLIATLPALQAARTQTAILLHAE